MNLADFPRFLKRFDQPRRFLCLLLLELKVLATQFCVTIVVWLFFFRAFYPRHLKSPKHEASSAECHLGYVCSFLLAGDVPPSCREMSLFQK